MATNAGDTSFTSGSDPSQICNACGEPIASSSLLQKISCGHIFHKACLEVCIKTRPFCPICNARIITEPQTPAPTVSQVRTRSRSRTTANATTSNNDTTIQTATNTTRAAGNPEVVSTDKIQELVASIVSAQLSSFSAQMTQLIETNISASLSRLMPTSVAPNPPQQSTTSPQQMHTLPAVEDRTFRELFGIARHNESNTNSRAQLNNANSGLNISGFGTNASSDLASRPDKVLQVMSNWKLKFNGGLNGLSVDNFIYRVEALTGQTLQGNFDLLCGNASSLFDGKANDWFWRYHRSVPGIRWNALCRALREQYQDSRTDIDIRELIRERKQKPNESFDAFYESIIALTDRLHTPLSNDTLVEILRRNLLPEIQHEILNLEIKSLQFLRDTCRRREFFMQDMRRRHGFVVAKPNPMGKRISELDVPETDIEDHQNLAFEEISAVGLVCWNCNKNGHRYQECLSDRTIFCYGCGTPDTYKPNCQKCNSKNSKGSAPKSATLSNRNIDLE